MAYIAQRATRLSGRDYSPGETVPDDVVGSDEFTLVRLGMIALAPGASSGSGSGSEQTKAELELVRAELTLARAQLAVARAQLSTVQSTPASEETGRPAPKSSTKAKAGRTDTGGSSEAQ